MVLTRLLDCDRAREPSFKNCSLVSTSMENVTTMNLQPQTAPTGFKIVCTDCGSLSIKATDPANTSTDTVIKCRRCSAVRGTVADLQVLARGGRDPVGLS